jgi:hypothetical protein
VSIPDRMEEPAALVIEAALRGLANDEADALIARLPQERSPFQQRVVEELVRLDLTRLLWIRADQVTDVEIYRRKRWGRITTTEVRDLLLDRYRAVGLHGRVEAWIRNHPDTPKED